MVRELGLGLVLGLAMAALNNACRNSALYPRVGALWKVVLFSLVADMKELVMRTE